MKDLICLAEEFEFYRVETKSHWKIFNISDEIMLDYTENITEVIDIGDDKSLLHFK